MVSGVYGRDTFQHYNYNAIKDHHQQDYIEKFTCRGVRSVNDLMELIPPSVLPRIIFQCGWFRSIILITLLL